MDRCIHGLISCKICDDRRKEPKKKISYRIAIIRDDGHEMGACPIDPIDAACKTQEWQDMANWIRKLVADCPRETAEPVSSPGSTAPLVADNGEGYLFKRNQIVGIKGLEPYKDVK